MATLKTVNLQHPDATVPNLVLNDDGTVDGPGSSGLVAVKTVTKTDIFSASLGAGARTLVTGLTLTHAVADAANRLIIMAGFGAAQSTENQGGCGLTLVDGTTPIGIGNAGAALQARVTAGMRGFPTSDSSANVIATTFVYTPGDTTSRTYEVHAVNAAIVTATVYVNRNSRDSNFEADARTVSYLTIMEVKV